MNTPALHYGPDYREDVELADGTRIRFRPIEPADKPRLAQGLMELSPESQYLRFFTAKPRFTAGELRYLTEVDGRDHFAIVAAKLGPGDQEDGIGVARFVRLPEQPRVAEPAVVVIDSMQRRGIGRMLMDRLIEAALERGVDVFHSEFLAGNVPMRELLETLSPETRFVPQGPVVTAEFALRAPSESPSDATPDTTPRPDIYTWMRLVAEQAVQLRRRFEMLFDPH